MMKCVPTLVLGTMDNILCANGFDLNTSAIAVLIGLWIQGPSKPTSCSIFSPFQQPPRHFNNAAKALEGHGLVQRGDGSLWELSEKGRFQVGRAANVTELSLGVRMPGIIWH